MSAAARPIPESFAPEGAERLGVRAPWLDERRARALEAFRSQGLPHRRVEEWKYSDLHNAVETEHQFPAETAQADPFGTIAWPCIVLRDGVFDAVQSGNDEGVEIENFARPGKDAPDWIQRQLGQVLTNAMGNASLAFMEGGVALRVCRGTEAHIHLRFVQKQEIVHSRVLIEIEEGASLFLLESHASAGSLTNVGMEVVIRPGARLTQVRVAPPAPAAVQVEEIAVRVASGARFEAHFAPGGAKLSRLELVVALEGDGAEAKLTGAAALSKSLHTDVTTHVDHIASNTASTQLFKFVAGGHARAVYQGKISVRQGADGSDSRQTAKAILSGDRAEADLKPELEILADDVQCAHGAAVGDLDPDSLFYLRARGIPEAEARRLLVRGFLEEAVETIGQENVRNSIRRFLEGALECAT